MAERLYDYTNQRETGEASNLYWNNFSKQVTAAELKELFNAEDNGQLRKAFGSFDNYLAYMDERQDLINAGELDATWWDTGVALIDPTTVDRELAMDDKALEQFIIDRGVQLSEQAYEQQSPALNALYEKYTGGKEGTWYNSDGDKFRWNGTSFVKTAKVDDSFNVNSLILTLAATGMAMSVAAPLADKIGASMSSSLGLGEKATEALITGLQNGLTSAGATTLQGKELTGNILADTIWGTLSPSVISALGITPDTFVSSFVDSLGSDVVTNFVTGEDFDWQSILENAAAAGGITAVKDFFADWLSTKNKEQLKQHYLQSDYAKFSAMSPEEFDEWLLNDPSSLLNTTDLGALVGPNGVLTKVFGFEGTSEYLSTEWFDSGVKTVTDFLGSLGVGKALSVIANMLPEGEEDPFYGKGDPYLYDEQTGVWYPNPNLSREEIDRWNTEFLYGGELDERYWHSWQERDPNSTVQGIWENPMTPETGGLGGFFGSLVGTGGGLKISDAALAGTGVADPKGYWGALIDEWNNWVDTKTPEEQQDWSNSSGFGFTEDAPYEEPPSDDGDDDIFTDSVTGESAIDDGFDDEKFMEEPPPSSDDGWVEDVVDGKELPPEIEPPTGTQEPPSGEEEPPIGLPPATVGRGQEGAFSPFLAGISYDAQLIPEVKPPLQKDYFKELDNIILKHGMLT